MSRPIPATREEAIAALVESDVARWGESERDASRKLRSQLSYGLAINALANLALFASEDDSELRRAAKAALTSEDWRILRQGG